ncbi:MAG: Phytoene dehydrogenase [uncultured Frankineae bacterium]|uniref:Phytoene dehydrogenase n=1 Tax=uncultured Frankineae bacterium TaxID=437475 RepID=A0A6J4KU95_9ACTN|nr:MAG: Phytoene dehydrogenase [uncultured Frankineae bacterium]
MSRVVVIGAGVGGLAAAARLAAQGHAVTVCEAGEDVGGKLGLVTADVPGLGAFRFDTGPSLVTLPQVFRDLFADTGGWPEGLELTPLDPIARYRFADGSGFDATRDHDELCARLDALRPGNGDDWRAFTARAERVWAASREPFLESALHGPATIASLALRRPGDIAAIAPGRSLRSLGRRHLRDPRLRMVLDRYATYTGSDPRRAPAALAAVPYAELAFGGWYVTGGLHRLGLAVRDRAVERGAVLRHGARVTRIETTSGRASGVRLADGEHLVADVVVANTDAATVYGSLVDAPAAARRLARATPSLSGFVLLLAVEGRTPGLAHHNVLFPADYDAEFDAVFGDPARPVADPTLYVSAPDDPAVRPEGCEAWFVLVNAPRHRDGGPGRGAVDWAAPGLATSYAETLLDLLAARGLPVRDRVRWSQVLTPADLERRTGAAGGAIYGTSSNGASAAFLRPANRSPVPGLFLVGGSSHPGGGLPLVTLSAQIVAGLIGPA